MVNFVPEYGEILDAATLLTLYYDGEAGGLPIEARDIDNGCVQAIMYPAFLDLLTQPTITVQLCRVSGMAEKAPLDCSLTMLNSHRATFCKKEPNLFLLGMGFADHLAELSRYAEVTPYAFALAVSNPVRYGILNFLAEEQRPYTTVEIRQALHISKSTALQALRDMQTQGVLRAEHGQGAAHCYSLDRDALRHVADQLRQICSG